MTAKQQRFCEEYLIDCNTIRAYKAAYPQASEKSARNGYRLLGKAEVREYIGAQLEKLRSEKIADAQEVLEYLTAILRSAGEDGPEEDSRWGGKRPDERDRLKAAELLGKRYGLYNDKAQPGRDLDFRVVIDYGVPEADNRAGGNNKEDRRHEEVGE